MSILTPYLYSGGNIWSLALWSNWKCIFIRILSVRNRKYRYIQLKGEDKLFSYLGNPELGPFLVRLTAFRGSGFCHLFHVPSQHIDSTSFGCKVTAVALASISSHRKDQRRGEGSRIYSFHACLFESLENVSTSLLAESLILHCPELSCSLMAF